MQVCLFVYCCGPVSLWTCGAVLLRACRGDRLRTGRTHPRLSSWLLHPLPWGCADEPANAQQVIAQVAACLLGFPALCCEAVLTTAISGNRARSGRTRCASCWRTTRWRSPRSASTRSCARTCACGSRTLSPSTRCGPATAAVLQRAGGCKCRAFAALVRNSSSSLLLHNMWRVFSPCGESMA